MNKVFKLGLIGCGHISETYFRAQEYFNNIRIVKCADINMEAAKKCAIHYNIEAVTVEELLKDKEIEIILNLTIPRAHFEVSKMTLENGAIVERNFDTYKWQNITKLPEIEIHIVENGIYPSGVGEPATCVVAPAIGNAIFNATGVRLRSLPFSRQKLFDGLEKQA